MEFMHSCSSSSLTAAPRIGTVNLRCVIFRPVFQRKTAFDTLPYSKSHFRKIVFLNWTCVSSIIYEAELPNMII